MREFITADAIAGTIRMMRSAFKGSILVLEGDSDSKIMSQFILAGSCKIISGYGKEKAIEVIQILNSENFEGCLAIIDLDFDHIENCKSVLPNIYYTDIFDFDLMIFGTDIFNKVTAQFCSETKLQSFCSSYNVVDLKEFLKNSVRPLSLLKLHNRRCSLNISFQDLVFDQFVDRDSLIIDIHRLLTVIISKKENAKKGLNIDALKSAISILSQETYESDFICNGHDALHLFSIGLRKSLGSNENNFCKCEVVERIFRVGYSSDHFKITALYKNVKHWESRNSTYPVLSF